ncbi:hypothetical protein LPW30_14900, partial [Ectothiorhodospira variabilis]|nr:hypothetical protein [Ectothiorhodospira variabilis]
EALTMSLAQEWMDRGEAKGVQKGEAQMLIWLLEHKFGSQAPKAYQDSIEKADEPQIKAWSARLLIADRIEDVFKDTPPMH